MPRKDNRSKSPITYKQAVDYKPPVHIKPQLPYFKPQPILKPKFLDIVKEGFGFGFGSAIAHNTVNSLIKSMSTPDIHKSTPDIHKNNCDSIKKAFEMREI